MRSYHVHKVLVDAVFYLHVQAMTIPLKPKGLHGKDGSNLYILSIVSINKLYFCW